MLDRFEKQLSQMPANGNVAKMHDGVRQMKILVATSDQPIPEQSLRELSVLCDKLLEIIVAEPSKQ